jgi:hypothetical protein
MNDDYRVKSLKNSEVRAIAKRQRDYYGVGSEERIDNLACVKRNTVLTVNGEKRLNLNILSDNEMALDDGTTSYDGTTINISIKRTIHQRAYIGDGYARNTIAHELGHAVMHYETMTHGAKLARRTIGNKTPGWLKFYESAEHQTKVFAPAFLINEDIARTLSSATEISVRFGVSQQSAEIYFAELIAEIDRPKQRAELGQQIRAFADEFKRSTTDRPVEIQYLSDPCTCCGRPTVFPVGHKFMCQTCDTIYDRFQDGDRAE